MSFTVLSVQLVDQLKQKLPNSRFFDGSDDLLAYSHDETEDLVFPPELVVVCSTVPEISELVRYCNEHRVPLTVRGAGTGLSGAALAVEGGI